MHQSLPAVAKAEMSMRLSIVEVERLPSRSLLPIRIKDCRRFATSGAPLHHARLLVKSQSHQSRPMIISYRQQTVERSNGLFDLSLNILLQR